MLNTVFDILQATGQELLQPICFGTHEGKYIYDLSAKQAGSMARAAGRKPEEFISVITAAGRVKNAQRKPRRVFDQKNGLPAPFIPLKWQLDFATLCKDKQYYGLFAEMGTGKTLAMLNLMRARWQGATDKALIVCPLSVIDSWLKTFNEWLPMASVEVLQGTVDKRVKILNKSAHFYLVNYEAVLSPKLYKAIQEKRFTWLILDESHKIKNPTAKRTIKINDLAASIEMRFCMTGTPITNKEEDIYSQVSLLDRGLIFGPSVYVFRNRFCRQVHVTNTVKKWEFVQSKRGNLRLAMDKVSFRVLKKDVLDLPDKNWQTLTCELSGETLRVYKEIRDEALTIINDETITAPVKIAEIMRLRQITGGTMKSPESGDAYNIGNDKADLLCELLEAIKRPAIVIVNYRAEIPKLIHAIKKAGLTVAVGATGGAKQADLIYNREQFINGFYNVLVMNQQSGGLGIDGLQAGCSDMVFYNCNYSYEQRIQCEDRLHRKGQSLPVNYYDLLATLPGGKETIDNIILDAIRHKETSINELVNNIRGRL